MDLPAARPFPPCALQWAAPKARPRRIGLLLAVGMLFATAVLVPGTLPAQGAPARPAAPRFDPPTNTPTPTPLPRCGSLAVATFVTGCQYDPGNEWTNIDYQADLVNGCSRPVTAQVTLYLQVTEDDPPTGGWVCWDEVTLPSQQFPAQATTTLLDTWVGEQIAPAYLYYRLLMRIESPDLCETFDTYSAPDGLCTPRGAQVPEHTTCIIPPPPEPTPTVTCAPSDWCTSLSPSSAGPNELRDVAVLADNNIWAVGGQNGQSLIEHWDGVIWRIVSDRDDVGPLNGVAAASATDLWAVGDNGLLHYTGSRWSQVAGRPGANAVAVRAAGDVWVVGSSIQHWTGTWSSEAVPGGGVLTGVAVGRDEIWAVGNTGSTPTRQIHAVRRVGSTWQAQDPPALSGDAYLTGIDLYDDNTVWAVGTYSSGGINGYYQTLTEHWDGTQWRRVDSPNPGAVDNRLANVWMTTDGDVWAVGAAQRNGTAHPTTLILHWNDTDWQEVQSPAPGVGSTLLGVATISGNTAVVTSTWAVGSYTPQENDPSETLVEHFSAPAYPGHTTSYYENNIDLALHYQQGCNAAMRGEHGIIVLSYGQPKNWGTTLQPRYGTYTVGQIEKAFITDPDGNDRDITHAVKRFADGFHDAFYNPGASCSTSGPVNGIVIAVGINNDTRDNEDELTAEHAQAWAGMIDTIKGLINYSEVKIAAAIDAEPDFNVSYTKTKNWTEAYDATNVSRYYNFGSTDSYPAPAPNDPTPPVPPPWCCSAWTVEQLYHVTYGINAALALPQIYMPQFARNWNRVKRWSIESHQALPLYFSGEMSECGSSPCLQQPGAFFSEDQAWQVFWHQLNVDPQTRQAMSDATDIRCGNGSTEPRCQ